MTTVLIILLWKRGFPDTILVKTFQSCKKHKLIIVVVCIVMVCTINLNANAHNKTIHIATFSNIQTHIVGDNKTTSY